MDAVRGFGLQVQFTSTYPGAGDIELIMIGEGVMSRVGNKRNRRLSVVSSAVSSAVSSEQLPGSRYLDEVAEETR